MSTESRARVQKPEALKSLLLKSNSARLEGFYTKLHLIPLVLVLSKIVSLLYPEFTKVYLDCFIPKRNVDNNNDNIDTAIKFSESYAFFR